MKLSCQRSSLAMAFHTVGGVIPTRTPKEILKNLKLEVENGKATLIGTDQEVGIRYEIPEVETDSVGEILLPTTEVSSILREVQDDVIELEMTESALWVRAGHSEFRLSAIDPTEFPPVSEFEEEKYFVVPSSSLKQLIGRTILATDVESTRYALGGVLVDVSSEKITLAATDSRRLAVASAACRAEGIEVPEAPMPVIPSKAMALIEKSLSDTEEDVYLAIRENDVLVKNRVSTIYSRLVEGRFPQYQDVIPKESKSRVELPVGAFHAAVRQAQIVVSKESRGVDFTFSRESLTLKSVAADVGESTVEMPISFDGDDLVITFDPRYVADFLRVLDPATTVTLHLIDHESAAVFRTDDAYLYVIMPLSREQKK